MAGEARLSLDQLINRSGTRREELLLEAGDAAEELDPAQIAAYPMDEIEAMEFMLEKMKATKNNHDFFTAMKR
jgi:transcription termination factor Rho